MLGSYVFEDNTNWCNFCDPDKRGLTLAPQAFTSEVVQLTVAFTKW